MKYKRSSDRKLKKSGNVVDISNTLMLKICVSSCVQRIVYVNVLIRKLLGYKKPPTSQKKTFHAEGLSSF